MNCDKVSIKESIFTDLKAQSGGAIYLEQADSVKQSVSGPSYEIISTQISNSEAYIGGALYIQNPEYMQILSSTFSNNRAYNDSEFILSGVGGAIYYTCDSAWLCQLDIMGGNVFESN